MMKIEDQYYIDDSGLENFREPSGHKPTFLLYMTHEDDEIQQERIKMLHEVFGSNFYLVWDDKKRNPHSFGAVNTITDQPITRTRKFSHQCCAQEKAIMWLIENAGNYDFAWLVENDVYFESVQVIRCFFEKYAHRDADLLHQNQNDKPHYDLKHWHFRFLVSHELQPGARFKPPFYKGMFNLFRMSSRMVLLLDHWRLKNREQWTFFEPLIATLAGQSSYLDTLSFDLSNPSMKLRHRPIFTSAEAEILHPVKGNFKQPFKVDGAELTTEIMTVIPLAATLLLVDGDQFGMNFLAGHKAVPFTEHNGRYWGPPENSCKAIRELEDKRLEGVQYIAICQPAFWWLRYYAEFANHLNLRYKRLTRTKNVVVYDLRTANQNGRY